MICDVCNSEWHSGCMDVDVAELPDEHWACPDCASNGDGKGMYDKRKMRPKMLYFIGLLSLVDPSVYCFLSRLERKKYTEGSTNESKNPRFRSSKESNIPKDQRKQTYDSRKC